MNEIDEAVYARRWAILGVLCLSLVLIVVGNTSLNVALPRLSTELDATSSQLQWIVDAYAIVFAGMLLPAGALGDRFGRKGALQLGLVVFAVASATAALVDDPSHLIACRAVMGIGAAFVMPGTLSILANAFPPRERPKAIAIWAGFAGAGGAIGILSSGFLLEHFWWGSTFLLNVTVALFALALGAFLLPTSRDPAESRLDLPGSLLSIGGLGALVYACIEAPEKGWLHGETIGFFVAAVVLLAGFVSWEKRSAQPMLDLTLFGNRRFTMGCVVIFFGFLTMFGMFFLITQYLQAVRGYSPLSAGVRLLPFTLAMMIAAPRSAALVDRVGGRVVVCAGLVSGALGLGGLAMLDVDSSYLLFMVAALLVGAGIGLTMPPSTGAIMSSLPLGKAGVGSAVNDTTREVGAAVGIAVLGSLLSSQYRSAVGDGPAGLDASQVERAREGIGQALSVASERGDAVGAQLVDTARAAYIDGMRLSFVVAGTVLAITAIVVARLMPAGRLAPAGGPPATRSLEPDPSQVA